jgi:hypothetical protein
MSKVKPPNAKMLSLRPVGYLVSTVPTLEIASGSTPGYGLIAAQVDFGRAALPEDPIWAGMVSRNGARD